MKFERIVDRGRWFHADVHTLGQWHSDTGRWVASLQQMFFGIRFRLGPADCSMGVDVDYCCGMNQAAVMLLPLIVFGVLKDLPEDATSPEVRDRLPLQRRKPIENDPDCWGKLCALAGVPPIELADQPALAIPTLAEQVFSAAEGGSREF